MDIEYQINFFSCSTLSIFTFSSGFHYFYLVCMHAKSLQFCQTLQPMDCSPPGSCDHGILQARILEWLAISSSRESAQPRERTASPIAPALADRFFTTSATWEAPST